MSPEAPERKHLLSGPGLIHFAPPALNLQSVPLAAFILVPHRLGSPFLLHTPRAKPCPGTAALASVHIAKSSRRHCLAPLACSLPAPALPCPFPKPGQSISPFTVSYHSCPLPHSHSFGGPARQESRTWELAPAVWTSQVLSNGISCPGLLLPHLHSLPQRIPEPSAASED